jgi:hypothetical protein
LDILDFGVPYFQPQIPCAAKTNFWLVSRAIQNYWQQHDYMYILEYIMANKLLIQAIAQRTLQHNLCKYVTTLATIKNKQVDKTTISFKDWIYHYFNQFHGTPNKTCKWEKNVPTYVFHPIWYLCSKH